MEGLILSAEEAFLHIGTMIGVFIILFGYINYKTSNNISNIISKSKNIQPLIGAIIGAMPGCSGSLIIMPLYIKNKLSFGCIIASLISSMGDASFILISSNFKLYVFISVVGIITGTIVGYLVDIFNLESKLRLKKRKYIGISNKMTVAKLYNNKTKIKRNNIMKNKFTYIITYKIGYKIYIGIILIGFLFMLLVNHHTSSNLNRSIHYLEKIISIIGILFSIVYMMCFKKSYKNLNIHSDDMNRKSIKEILIASSGEISFIITWIYISYILYNLIIFLIGGEQYLASLVISTSIFSVLIASFLGMIPGCGIQIVLMSFFLKGNIPLGVIIANSISQDGDALFPLIALDKKSAIWATIITTIPAIIVGSIFYVFM